MAQRTVQQYGVSIRSACQAFQISQACYRYVAQRNDEDEQIARWLMRLTDNNRNWGFGLCFLHLRNVRGFVWNHKRVYRIYRELELNLRIKPRKRLVREKQSVTADTALRLAKVFGTSPQYWINLQTTHDLSKAAIEGRGELERIEPLHAPA